MLLLCRFYSLDGKVYIAVAQDPGKFQVSRWLHIIIDRGIKFLKMIMRFEITINTAGATRASSSHASLTRSIARNTNSCKFI